MKKNITLNEMWGKHTPEQLRAIHKISYCDGHTVFKISAYENAGMNKQLLEHFIETIKSDGTPKGTLFDNSGKALPPIQGIYGLRVIRSLANFLQCEVSTMMGRGSEARQLCGWIDEKLSTR